MYHHVSVYVYISDPVAKFVAGIRAGPKKSVAKRGTLAQLAAVKLDAS